MHAIGERKAPHAAAEDVRQNRDANHGRAEPRRNAAVGRDFGGESHGKRPRRDRLNDVPGAQDIDHHVGHDPAHKDRKENEADRRTLKTIGEILDLRAIAEAFAVIPELRADEEKASRMDQARPGGHLAVDADAPPVRLARASHQGERGHRGPEDGHHQQERPASAAGQEKIDRRVPLAANRAQQAHRDQEEQIAADHAERNHGRLGERMKDEG